MPEAKKSTGRNERVHLYMHDNLCDFVNSVKSRKAQHIDFRHKSHSSSNMQGLLEKEPVFSKANIYTQLTEQSQPKKTEKSDKA